MSSSGILDLNVRKHIPVTSNWITKRILDYAIATALFLVSIPFLAVCAAWIKAVSPGPAFFRQQREGKDGKPITVMKLRTMYPNAELVLLEHLESHPEDKEGWLRCYKLKHDPRVLPVIGAFLRRYSLDELPQLWNVLRGDMSLVGPRPLPSYHLSSFSEAFLQLRRSVMPGVTGLWQVSARSDGDLSVQEREDTYYIRNWSLWLDFYILLRTIKTLVIPNGAY
jgi:lipopolysaccharide/colanic/teichoic acid biosynthesis glycosyltransferase